MRNLTKKLLVFLLVAATVITSYSPVSAYAASKNHGYWFTYSNAKGSLDAVGWEKNGYETQFSTRTPYSIKSAKINATVYIPKTALKKGNDIGLYVSICSRNPENFDETLGITYGRYDLRISTASGKPVLVAGDAVAQKDISAKKTKNYYTIKAGKGKLKKFYILTIKNVPLQPTTYLDGKTVKLGSAKYPNILSITIAMGSKKKASGKIFIDNISIKKGSKKLEKGDFEDLKNQPWIDTWHGDGMLSESSNTGFGVIK